MNDRSCYDCTHRKVDHENYPYCGRTGNWLGVHDKAYCCVHYEVVDDGDITALLCEGCPDRGVCSR